MPFCNPYLPVLFPMSIAYLPRYVSPHVMLVPVARSYCLWRNPVRLVGDGAGKSGSMDAVCWAATTRFFQCINRYRHRQIKENKTRNSVWARKLCRLQLRSSENACGDVCGGSGGGEVIVSGLESASVKYFIE